MFDRKSAIQAAALDVFVERGYSAATIAEIGRRSQSTVGSIYHAFDGKAGMARTIWTQAVAHWHLEQYKNDKPRKAIRATLEAYLTWGAANRGAYRLYDEIVVRAGSEPEFAPLAQDIAEYDAAAARVYQAWRAQKLVRKMDWPLASGLIYGPASEFLRKEGTVTPEIIEKLAHLAWLGVKVNKS